jgi:hypothetical protein
MHDLGQMGDDKRYRYAEPRTNGGSRNLIHRLQAVLRGSTDWGRRWPSPWYSSLWALLKKMSICLR